MKYQQIQPPDYLSAYVRYFWILENDSSVDVRIMNPFADGCPGIIFQHSSEGQFYDETGNDVPDVFLYGQTIQPVTFQVNGNFKTIGVCFYPYALKAIFGMHASELTDSCVDLTLITKPIKELLLNAISPKNQFDIFSGFIKTQIVKREPQDDTVTTYALTEIVKAKGNVNLKKLQDYLKISERAFQRRFEQHVGISPKLFSRVCQFQASLNQLKNSNFTNLSDIAYDNGYADQSHFIRSFKSFAGFSPMQFQKRNHGLTDNFSVY
jgi:AraC-like DNA-binding protein